MRLALDARRLGVRFVRRHDGTITTIGLDRLSNDLRAEVLTRIDDIRACISEHSVPCEFNGSDVADEARRIILAERRRTMLRKPPGESSEASYLGPAKTTQRRCHLVLPIDHEYA
jgi:hypothetical protein